MKTEELYIWRYGIDKLPKGLLEYGIPFFFSYWIFC